MQKKFHLLIILLPCWFLGCVRPINQNSVTKKEEKNYMQEAAMQVVDGAEVFFILRDQKIVPIAADKTIPSSFYIKGVIEGGDFVPKSAVLGVGDLAKDGTRYGWLELKAKEFYPMESDKKALTPFVKGYITSDGSFVPSMREVFDEP